jgi:hypothetical protein
MNEALRRTSVTDPECLSQILIFPDLGSLIPDPTTAPKKKREIFFVLPFL